MLTNEQQRAVQSDSGSILCIAGAGAGKTKVLVERLRRLLREGFGVHDFLVVTFTRKASGELLGRLAGAMREDGFSNPEKELRSMMCGTFHSLALRILKVDGDLLGYDKQSLSIVNEDDCRILMNEIREDYGVTVSAVGMDKYANAYYSGMILPDDQQAKFVLEEYHKRLFEMNALDFGLILREAQRVLEYDHVIAKYHSRIKHVFVDELQDTDLIQYNLHDYFTPPASFFGCCDLRQTLYQFRGARPELAYQRHSEAEIVDLTHNFRSTKTIVSLANSVIRNNGEKEAGKPMVAVSERAGEADHINCARYDLVSHIKESLNLGFGYSDIAVLARSHNSLRKLSVFLEDRGIPYHRCGQNMQVCDTQDFKKLEAIFRLTCNTTDDLAFLRLRKDLGIGRALWQKVRRDAAHHGASRFGCLPKENDVTKWIDHTGDIEVNQAIDQLESFRLFSTESLDFMREHCGNLSLSEAVQWVELRDSQDDVPDGEVISLLTVHASKGLEWPLVYVVDMDEGKFPTRQAVDIEAERRIAYVAITRAQEKLVLHSSGEVSRFVHEALGID